MKQYTLEQFKTKLNKIYCCDCLKGMIAIPDSSIDLVITDPPYLINYRSNRRKNKEDRFNYIKNDDKDNNELIEIFMRESYRILKKNTAIYIFCSWHNIDFFKKLFEKYFKMKNLIVWNKNNHGSGDLRGSYAPKHELILFGHKGRSLLRNKRISDVIDFDKISSKRLKHPTEKPLGLLEIFIEKSSDKGSIILDPFIGSGTTAIACKKLHRNFIGFEISQEYVDITNKRLVQLKEKKI